MQGFCCVTESLHALQKVFVLERTGRANTGDIGKRYFLRG